MIFNSLAFALFLPSVLLLYHLGSHRWQNLVLLASGYVFYGFWDTRFLFLVSVSTVLDFCTGLMIAKGRMTLSQRLQATTHLLGFGFFLLLFDWHKLQLGGPGLVHLRPDFFAHDPFTVRVFAITVCAVAVAHAAYPWLTRLREDSRRRVFLRASLFGQLGMLGVFKYYNFFVESANALAQRLGFEVGWMHLHIILPIGISFYTFQTLSYVCDVYWRRLAPVEHLPDFALFVSYFPPLVAGPIERASHLLPRILGERTVTVDAVLRSMFLIALGLFKKVAIADGIAGSVASVYGSSGHVGWSDVAGATVGFAIQIYCDFSGYSDIASGCSLLFGIELLKNFDQPYFSVNPSEFWRRWHISLSSWLRDYLYIPLGGNRGSEQKTRRNLLLTMLVGGLWHGAAWNFVLWGFYQGVMLVGHRAITGRRPAPTIKGLRARLPRMALFFAFVCYGWLLFRASSFEQIAHFTKILFSDFSDMSLHMKAPTFSAIIGIPVLALLELHSFKVQSPVHYRCFAPPLRAMLYACIGVLIVFGASNESQQFIYFQF